MAGNPIRHNQSLYFHYHQDQGHTTEDYRNLWDHLDQLIQKGKLKQLLHHSSGQGGQIDSESRRDDSSKPPLGTINVIFATLRRTSSIPSRVMYVAHLPAKDSNSEPKRARIEILPVLGFSNEDKIETIQPHDDALVVTLRIGGYDVKRVLVNQGNAVEILKPEDLTTYDCPLASFEGKTIISKGQIRLPIQTDSEVVKVDFIVVDAYSPYTAIVPKPWHHVLGAVSSTLHQKVKYPSEG